MVPAIVDRMQELALAALQALKVSFHVCLPWAPTATFVFPASLRMSEALQFYRFCLKVSPKSLSGLLAHILSDFFTVEKISDYTVEKLENEWVS